MLRNDYEVIGHKIAEMVGNIYEHELKTRDDEIERLRQQETLLIEALSDMISDKDCLSDATLKFARDALAKARGGK